MPNVQLNSYFSNVLEEAHLPNLSIDCVIFGYHKKEMKVLLTSLEGARGWLLPGGLIRRDENLDDAAYRVLEERTGVKGVFLKQFHTFGNKDRRSKNHEDVPQLPEETKAVKLKIAEWVLTKRFVSVCYYALTEFNKVIPQTGFIEEECSWFDIHYLPHLLIDHKEIFDEVLKTLQRQIHSEPIGLNLLPKKFTLPELQALYETLLAKKLDQRNFTKKLISLDIIKKLDEKRYIGSHRSPTLYKFNKRAYDKALKQGVELAF